MPSRIGVVPGASKAADAAPHAARRTNPANPWRRQGRSTADDVARRVRLACRTTRHLRADRLLSHRPSGAPSRSQSDARHRRCGTDPVRPAVGLRLPLSPAALVHLAAASRRRRDRPGRAGGQSGALRPPRDHLRRSLPDRPPLSRRSAVRRARRPLLCPHLRLCLLRPSRSDPYDGARRDDRARLLCHRETGEKPMLARLSCLGAGVRIRPTRQVELRHAGDRPSPYLPPATVLPRSRAHAEDRPDRRVHGRRLGTDGPLDVRPRPIDSGGFGRHSDKAGSCRRNSALARRR